MTFYAFKLQKNAPQKQVWFARCDVCQDKTEGPFGNAPSSQQSFKTDMLARGWRYQIASPMDTCPSCLAREP